MSQPSVGPATHRAARVATVESMSARWGLVMTGPWRVWRRLLLTATGRRVRLVRRRIRWSAHRVRPLARPAAASGFPAPRSRAGRPRRGPRAGVGGGRGGGDVLGAGTGEVDGELRPDDDQRPLSRGTPI